MQVINEARQHEECMSARPRTGAAANSPTLYYTTDGNLRIRSIRCGASGSSACRTTRT